MTSTDDDGVAHVKPAWAAEAFNDLDGDVRQSIARIRSSATVLDERLGRRPSSASR